MVRDTSVVINFVNSSSEDAVRNILLRREIGKVKFDTIFSNTNSIILKFIDTKIIGGRTYEYAMIAKDDGGLFSKISKSIRLKTLIINKLSTPKVEGFYDAKAKKAALTFVIDDKLKNRKLNVEIYKRSDSKSPWTVIKILDLKKTKQFLDEPESGQKELFYTVRLIDENKNSSNFSNELHLKF